MGEQRWQDRAGATWHIITGINHRPFLERGLEGISSPGGSRILDVDTHSKLGFSFCFVFVNTSCFCCCMRLDTVLLGCRTRAFFILCSKHGAWPRISLSSCSWNRLTERESTITF